MSEMPEGITTERVTAQREGSDIARVREYAIWARDVVARAFAESRGRSKIIDTVSIKELKVEKGTVLGIVGGLDSGLGTFFQLSTGNIRPDKGEFLLFGRKPALGRKDVGLASYRFDLYGQLTVHENLALLGELGLEAGVGKALIPEILDVLDIGDLANAKYRNLSESERRLVLLAQALLKEPTLMLVENIVQGLDMLESIRVIGALSKMINNGRDITYLIGTSFYDEDLFALFTHIALVEQGRVTNSKRLVEQSPSAVRQDIVAALSSI